LTYQANKLMKRVKMNKVLVQVGNGEKLHVGFERIRESRPTIIITNCGSRRSGTAQRIIGVYDAETYTSNARHCEKCAEKVAA
jgi:hypothetical protein